MCNSRDPQTENWTRQPCGLEVPMGLRGVDIGGSARTASEMRGPPPADRAISDEFGFLPDKLLTSRTIPGAWRGRFEGDSPDGQGVRDHLESPDDPRHTARAGPRRMEADWRRRPRDRLHRPRRRRGV